MLRLRVEGGGRHEEDGGDRGAGAGGLRAGVNRGRGGGRLVLGAGAQVSAQNGTHVHFRYGAREPATLGMCRKLATITGE